MLLAPLLGAQTRSADRRFTVSESAADISVGATAAWRASENDKCLLNRVAGVFSTPSGGLVVVNAGENQLCEFDKRGALITVHGHKGSGPGEYVAPITVSRVGTDSILIYDEAQRRFSWLDGHGQFVRDFRPNVSGAATDVVMSVVGLRNGNVVIGFSDITRANPSSQAVSFSQSLFVVAPNGRMIRKIGSVPSTEHFVQTVPTQFGGVAYWDRAFGKRAVFAPLRDGFLMSDAASLEFTQYDANGIRRQRWTSDTKPRPVSSADIARYKSYQTAQAKPQEREVTQLRVNAMPYPNTYPALRKLFTDGQDNLWLQPFSDPSGAGADPLRWSYWNSRTNRTFTVVMPKRFRPMEFSSERVCGVERDNDDIESVVCYALVRK